MTPQDRSLLIGGAAFILAMVGLYLGMAVIGTGDQADTTTDASADAAAEIEGGDRDIELDSQADADVVSRLVDDGPNGGIDPAGPSSANSSTSSSSTTAQPRSASEPTAAPTSSAPSTTTEPVAPTPNPPSSVPPSSDPTGVPPNPEPSAPNSTTSTTTSSTTSTTTTVPSSAVPSSAVPSSEAPPPTGATTAPPTTVASTQPSTTEPPPTDPPAGGLDAVEQEILKLTNELRADPAGRLAREKPMPSCVTDPFYGIAMDAATGHPSATPALVLDEAVSLGMSRPWAVEMNGRNDLQHRPNGSQLEIYRSLDITVSATGENIAWFSGYPDEEAARVHFEGWRESDTGHYCAMVSGTYASIGVGHFKGATRSWAVQNFYSTR